MAKKKKQKGSPVNNLEVVTECKEHFLALCLQYDCMGRQFAGIAKVVGHPQFKTTVLPVEFHKILSQYQEMGQEMKNIGTLLDFMSGKKVMKAEEPEKEPKDEGTFVNNIEPEDDEDEKKKDEDGKSDE